MSAAQSKLMDMLSGYAAAHQHPVNIAVHLVGIPVIMLGVFIVLAGVTVQVDNFAFNLAQVAVVGLFLFYLTLDRVFALVFLLGGYLVAMLAGNALCLLGGAAWLSMLIGLPKAVAVGVTPFLLGAALKSALAAATLRAFARNGRC